MPGPFSFDQANPIDTFLIPNYPSNERDHRLAVFEMLEIEHDTVEGYHKFGIGGDTERDAVEGDMKVGAVWLYNQGGVNEHWTYLVSVGPPVWDEVDARKGAPHIDEQSLYTVTQWADYFTITLTGGGPGKLCEVDFDASPAQFVTIDDDVEIQNPVGVLDTLNTSTIQLEVVMDGSGAHAVTFGTSYRAPGGIAPVIDSAAGGRTMLFITQMRNSFFMVTSSPGLASF